MKTAPTGNATFLFTDVEGSTKLSQSYPEKLAHALERHHSILVQTIESNSGYIFQVVGDAIGAAFENAADAVKAACDAQKLLSEEKWDDVVIKVRMGIHSGNVEWSGSGYIGYITLARVSRLMSVAHGEQIVISKDAYSLAQDLTCSEKVKGISYRDMGERRLKDVIQPIRIYQIISPDLRSDFPPLKTLDARPNNLPVQISNFIGREIEIRHINDSLETAALITLTGTGGSGKTRLALQAGAEVIDNFADGVWFIELAELNDGDLLAQVIGRTFGLDENSGNKPDEALIEFLKKKEALLIIDNCEHIIDASAMLTEKLLASCPRLKIISTSREAMKINGEKIIRVDSLTTPDPLELATSETVSQFEAVRLFIDRALAVDSNFQVNNDNAPALAEICHRLDGIPLAIELAAARTKVLPLEKINDRLSDRFKLLTGGKRTVLPRQQTLRAMIDWSYDLLNEDEKLLFRRLSVFAGGWTLEAAEEICSDEYLDSYDLIDILTGLLDKSLITSKDDSENMRFGMLETIRQYAKEMAGDISATREKHSEYFRKITLAADVLEGKIDMIAWAKSIDGDIANIKRAIFRSLKDNSQRAVEMLSSIGEYWVLRGYYREGYITCKKVLEFNEIIDPLQRSMAIYAMGHMASILGNMQESRKLGEECLALSRIAGDKYAIANACSLVGLSHSSSMKHDDESWERYEEALQLFSELGSRYNKASVLYNMSFVAAKRSDKELSQKLKKEALEIYRELKNPVKIALTLTGLGSTELKQGNLEEARTYIQESLTVSEPTKDKYMTSINLVLLGCINSGTGDFDTAQKYFDESLKISKECGYVANIIPTLYHIGDAFFKSGDFDNAGKSYVESIKTGAEREIDFYLVHNIFGLGLIYFAKDDFKRSLTILQIGKKILNGTYGTIGKPKADEADEYIVKNEDILGAKQSESIRSSVDVMSEEEMISFVVES